MGVGLTLGFCFRDHGASAATLRGVLGQERFEKVSSHVLIRSGLGRLYGAH